MDTDGLILCGAGSILMLLTFFVEHPLVTGLGLWVVGIVLIIRFYLRLSGPERQCRDCPYKPKNE